MVPTGPIDAHLAALLDAVTDDAPLRGTFFLYDAREMLRATRQIERAARELGGTLHVGFQDAARLDDEARAYRAVTDDATVIAYGVGRPAHRIDGLAWVAVPRDRHALENQWFLVLTGDGPIAFSPAASYRKGPSHNAERTWEGFTTNDVRMIEHLVDRLERVRELSTRKPGAWYLVATDDGGDPRYTAARTAAIAHLVVDTGATAMRDAIARHTPDAVFLPAHLARPSLLDRVRGNTLTAIAKVVDVPIRLVDEAGTVVSAETAAASVRS